MPHILRVKSFFTFWRSLGLTNTLKFPQIPAPPLAAAGLLGPDLDNVYACLCALHIFTTELLSLELDIDKIKERRQAQAGPTSVDA